MAIDGGGCVDGAGLHDRSGIRRLRNRRPKYGERGCRCGGEAFQLARCLGSEPADAARGSNIEADTGTFLG